MSRVHDFAHDHERLTELLLDRALQGLDSDESAELRTIVEERDGFAETFDPGGFEQAAAMATLALVGQPDQLPEHLRARLTDVRAASFIGITSTSEKRSPAKAASTSQQTQRNVDANVHQAIIAGAIHPMSAKAGAQRDSNRAWGGWVAAAACLMLALLAWLPKLADHTVEDAATQRAQLLADRPSDLVMWTWTPGNDPANPALQGDIVWSDERQKGYMRLAGLARNDPAREQYQLWIFDAQRNADYPVDGGVFDVTSDGEVIIAMDPKLRVFNASMFAITVERPGGVARSERERIPALAKPAA